MNNYSEYLNELILEKIPEITTGGNIRKGSKINCRCFICGDSKKNRSTKRGWFYTNNDPISYYCFNEGCTASGNKLLAQMLNVTESEVTKMVFKRMRSEGDKREFILPKEEVKPIVKEERKELLIPNYWEDLTDDCKKVLKHRRILEAPYAPKKWKLYYSKLHKRIAIPWVDGDSNVVETFQYRSIYKTQSPKYMFKSETEKPLFITGNFDEEASFYAFTEGCFDSIFLYNGVAVGGIFPTNKQFDELRFKFPLQEPLWIPDNPYKDTASKNKIIEIAKTHPRMRVFKWGKYNKYKDINEMVIKEKNPNIFTKEYIEDNSTTAIKLSTALLFDRDI